MRKRGVSQSVRPAWLACREFIRAPPRPHQHGPPGATAAAILQPVSPRRSRVGARVWLAATDLCARKGEQRATIFLSTCGFSFVSVPLSLPSPASSIKRASLDPGRGGRAGHGHERRSKNEMRLKKQGAPAPLARAPCSRRRGMGVLMSTYLSPRSFEQNTSVAWHKPTIDPYLPLYPYRLRWMGGRLIIEFEISASTC